MEVYLYLPHAPLWRGQQKLYFFFTLLILFVIPFKARYISCQHLYYLEHYPLHQSCTYVMHHIVTKTVGSVTCYRVKYSTARLLQVNAARLCATPKSLSSTNIRFFSLKIIPLFLDAIKTHLTLVTWLRFLSSLHMRDSRQNASGLNVSWVMESTSVYLGHSSEILLPRFKFDQTFCLDVQCINPSWNLKHTIKAGQHDSAVRNVVSFGQC
jgi:hypothetical protein